MRSACSRRRLARCAPASSRREQGVWALVSTDTRYSVAAYVGKHGWINVDASGPLDWDEVRELVTESYCLNAPKRLAKLVSG